MIRGKLMVDLHIDKKENLSGYDNLLSSNKNYNRLMLYADEELKNYVLNCNQIIIERLNNKKDEILLRAKELIKQEDKNSYGEAYELLQSISGWKDSRQLIEYLEENYMISYVDFECPHCGETLSFDNWTIKNESEVLCPYCDKRVKLK